MSRDCFDAALLASKLAQQKPKIRAQSFNVRAPDALALRKGLLHLPPTSTSFDPWWEAVTALEKKYKDPKRQAAWFSKLSQTSVDYPSLSQKLRTCSLPNQRLQNFEGMSSLHILKGHNKVIFVVGEKHEDSKGDCPTDGKVETRDILNLITYLAAPTGGPPGILDVFVESAYRLNRKHSYSKKGASLATLRGSYSECFQFPKPLIANKECKKRLDRLQLRLHAMDVRALENVEAPSLFPVWSSDVRPEHKHTWKILLAKELHRVNERFWLFRELSFKQFRKVEQSGEYSSEELRYLANLRDQNIRAVERLLRETQQTSDLWVAQKNMREVDRMQNWWIDLYLVLRLLKPYTEKILIIVGDWHARNVIDILTHLDFHLVFEAPRTKTVKPESQCLSVPFPFSKSFQ